jgi:phosphoribosylaminoimidazole (AIR) synthetase
MNKLSNTKRAQVIAALVEGNSIRATARMTGVAFNTALRLLRVTPAMEADVTDHLWELEEIAALLD